MRRFSSQTLLDQWKSSAILSKTTIAQTISRQFTYSIRFNYLSRLFRGTDFIYLTYNTGCPKMKYVFESAPVAKLVNILLTESDTL